MTGSPIFFSLLKSTQADEWRLWSTTKVPVLFPNRKAAEKFHATLCDFKFTPGPVVRVMATLEILPL